MAHYDADDKEEEEYTEEDVYDKDDESGSDGHQSDLAYDKVYGDCYRLYSTFQCTPCKKSWTSDDVWYCYDEEGYRTYFPQQCDSCGKDRYPLGYEEKDYKTYVEDKNQLLISLKKKRNVDSYLVRRFGFYECNRCQNRWTSAWTWALEYLDQARIPQDCNQCEQRSNRGRRNRNNFGCLAYQVQPLLRVNRPRRNDIDAEEKHNKAACHYCRNLAQSCPQIFAGNPNPRIRVN